MTKDEYLEKCRLLGNERLEIERKQDQIDRQYIEAHRVFSNRERVEVIGSEGKHEGYGYVLFARINVDKTIGYQLVNSLRGKIEPIDGKPKKIEQ